MLTRTLFIRGAWFVALALTAVAQSNPSFDARIDDLIARMTLREKVGQMCQYVGIEHLKANMAQRGKVPSNDDAIGMYPNLTFRQIEELVRQGEIGSFLHVVTAEEANRLQALAAESRLGIPLIIGIDAIHGNAMVRGTTVYPTAIGLAATFDDGLVQRVARETAIEMRESGAQWTFMPNVDVARDARWGRVGETFGEDPYLVTRMGVAMVRGFEDPTVPVAERVLSCVKHAIAGSQPVNGLNGAPTDVSERTLRSVFLPPYLATFAAGTGSLMTAHNELNGVPCHANPWLVEDVFRGEGGFDGFVVSDWMDIERLETVHHIAANQREAAYLTLQGGMDMHMHGPHFLENVVALVEEGRVPESRIDQSVRRILRAKFKLGLFDDARSPVTSATAQTFSPAHQATALEAARKSIVLLTNPHAILPLQASSHRRLLVTGPLADTAAVLGDWTLPQPEEQVITPWEGIRDAAPAGFDVRYFDSGRTAKAVAPEAIADAVEAAATADAVIVVVGDNALRYDRADKTSGENIDRSDIEFPGNQLAFIQALVGTGKPVVVVMINSRPIGSPWTADHAAALVTAFEPGSFGGQAIGEVLFGAVNPSGRLPISIPRSAGHIQTIYNHQPSQYFHTYVMGKSDALFWFGHGLSYTTFTYGNLRVPAQVPIGGPVSITVDVTNTGDRTGDDVVFGYVRDLVSSTATPVKSLQAFQRLTLNPGETRTVQFTLSPDQLALIDARMQRVVEPGTFRFMVGDLAAEFEVTAP